MRILQQIMQIALTSGGKIIHADDIRRLNQRLTQKRSDKAGTACHDDIFAVGKRKGHEGMIARKKRGFLFSGEYDVTRCSCFIKNVIR